MGGGGMKHAWEMRIAQNFIRKKLKEDLGIDGKIVLIWILRKQDMKVWIRFVWFRIRTSAWFL
jgi:hypothetical protein